MSSHDTIFVPFGPWSPDSVEFDSPELEIAENFTPAYGTYRPIEKKIALSSQAETEPVIGGISHLVSEEAPPIRMLPIDNVQSWNGAWFDGKTYVKADGTNDFLAAKLGTFLPDDSEYIYGFGNCQYRLSAPIVTPVFGAPALGDVVLRFRARIKRHYQYDPYTIDYELREDGIKIGTTQTKTFNDPEGEDWEEISWEVPTAVFTAITDWDKLSIRISETTGTQLPAVDPIPLTIITDEDVGGYVGVAQDGAGIPEPDGTYTEDIYRFGQNIYGADWVSSYLRSPAVPPEESEVAIFEIDPIKIPEDSDDGNIWFSLGASATASKANVNIRYQIIQPVATGTQEEAGEEGEDVYTIYGDSEFRIIAEMTHTNVKLMVASEDGTAAEYESLDVLCGADLEQFTSINFDSKFYLAIITEYEGSGTIGEIHTGLVDAEPDGEWDTPASAIVDTDELRSCVGGNKLLADGVAGIYYPVSGGQLSAYPNLGTNNPQGTDDSKHTLWIRAKSSDTSSRGILDVQLYKDVSGTETRIKTWDITGIGTAWTWYGLGLTEAQAAKISDYSDLGLAIHTATTWPDYTLTIEIDEFFLAYPGDSAYSKIWEILFSDERGDWTQVSWMALDTNNPRETNTRDRTEIYVGNNSRLYSPHEEGWLDVTRVVQSPDGETFDDPKYPYADLSVLDAEPKIWDFCTFGDKVIATNFSDEIQVKDVTDVAFDALIDNTVSPYTPRARYCAVVSASLVLADINPSGYTPGGTASNYTDGKPFHLWASKPMDPTYFDLADLANQTALFALVGQPGAITGLVGGEWGTVFKRNSIWRMMYSGLPQLFQIDNISIGQGCAYPQSIVLVGQDIFFWGNGGIFVLVGGSQLQRLSGNVIEKALFDTLYEDIALAQDYGNDSVENESRVYGAYDAYSGVIWWLYRGKNDDAYNMSRFICFSTQDGRFTHGRINDFNASLILGRMNITTADSFLNRGLILFNNDASPQTKIEYAKFSNTASTYQGTLKTKILSTAGIGVPIGQECELQSIRPIYKADPETSNPNFAILVEAAQDPTMQRDKAEKRVDTLRADRDGWIPLGTPISGEYFRFTLNVPALSNAQLKEILGIQIKIRVAGTY